MEEKYMGFYDIYPIFCINLQSMTIRDIAGVPKRYKK